MSEIQPSQETLKEILSYFNQDNFLKAEELANTLIKDYSNNIFLLKILGVIHAKQGNFNKALEYNVMHCIILYFMLSFDRLYCIEPLHLTFYYHIAR